MCVCVCLYERGMRVDRCVCVCVCFSGAAGETV